MEQWTAFALHVAALRRLPFCPRAHSHSPGLRVAGPWGWGWAQQICPCPMRGIIRMKLGISRGRGRK